MRQSVGTESLSLRSLFFPSWVAQICSNIRCFSPILGLIPGAADPRVYIKDDEGAILLFYVAGVPMSDSDKVATDGIIYKFTRIPGRGLRYANVLLDIQTIRKDDVVFVTVKQAAYAKPN